METVTRARDMRARVQEFDWAATQLGPKQRWSPSLKWSVELVLASGFPMSVRWGPDLIMIYNDAYGALLGDRHPGAMGQPLREIWPEIYNELGALNQAILRGERDAFFAEDHPWRIHRYGIPEDARFTISYSPIPDASASNGIGGVLATGVVSSWNAGAQRIKGYAADEIIGRNFSQFYTPEDRKAGLPNRTLAIAAATGRFEAEAWRMRKDGSLFWANVVVDAIRGEFGKLVGFAKITRDITESAMRRKRSSAPTNSSRRRKKWKRSVN